MQAYSSPARETNPMTLPDLEIFRMSAKQMRDYGKESVWHNQEDKCYLEPGWYYWFCLPGCLPDSEPRGPFKNEYDALEDAQGDSADYMEEGE